MNEACETPNRLQNFPITLFATVMGLTGLAIALLRFEHILHIQTYAGKPLLYLITVWFFFLLFVYLLKLSKYPQEVKHEFAHPIKINFFPTISISLLLLSIGYEGVSDSFSSVLWYSGSIIHIIFTMTILNIWFFKDFKLQTKNPAWFIPVVGNILVPIAGVNHASPEISWFFFSIGLVLWIVLLAITIYRIVFHEQLMAKFMPTLFILIAPPAVGFIAYIKLTSSLDPFSRILYYFGLFTTLMLFTMFRNITRIPFFVSWWAYTFPMDAATISTLLMFKVTKLVFFKYLAIVFLIITISVILVVLAKTARAAVRGEICVPE
ncbi:SLAC1 anion channel family protein [Limisalsivibrio acetivorans]|uniref:SLAC1 anion channel family protein n=1 Tax=Limisalsivibrio acetivorans TaxID=1304888 RepID=UPI0003B76792|nr:SLAC1 anion channel family protein [Limisalsivibrio acetivorans]